MVIESVQQLPFQRIVANLVEGVIVIDRAGLISWANAAALAMHGVETIEQLGRDVARYRANYAFACRAGTVRGAGEAPVDRIMAGEALQDELVEVTRAGRDRAEWVHNLRGVVLTDDDGVPGCRILTMTDVTERCEAEGLFRTVMDASLSPAAICRLADLRFTAVNRGFLDLTGYAEEAVVGRSLYDVDVLRGAERRDLAVARLNEGRAIPRMEACLAVPADAAKWVTIVGEPIVMPGRVACMLFVFADLKAQRKAEADLRQSREQFEKTFQLSPVPTVRGRRDGLAITDVNKAFTALFGYGMADVNACGGLAFELWADQSAREGFERRLARDGRASSHEGTLRTKDGHEIDCLMSAETVEIDGSFWILCTIQDTTERRRSERELKRAIEDAMTDASWFSQKVLDKLALARATADDSPGAGGLDALTAREREILTQVAEGATDDTIASAFGISRNTVRNHLTALYRKLGVNRRSAAVVFARERGLVDAHQGGRAGQRLLSAGRR